jgi:hypothetical protein
MIEWWNSLGELARFFWSVALLASVLQLLLLVASLLGGGDFDHATDLDGSHAGGGGDHQDAAHGLKVLSFRALVAFGVGFGWAGALALGNGWSTVLAMGGAVIFGTAFTFVIYFLMRLLVAMQDPGGGLDYWNAVGNEGHVYFTVPGARSGQGQVEIMLQGRLITADAVTEHPDPIPPRAPVTILSVEGESLLVVEPATVREHLVSH